MRLDGRAIGIFIVTIILLIVPIGFLIKILYFNNIASTKSNHELTIVLATDDRFVEPTAVLMQSVKLSTPQSKTFIIIGDEVSTANRTKLQQMQDKKNTIKIFS